MPNYNQSKIYKIEPIVKHEEQDIYYGSTTETLSTRMSKHRYNYKQKINTCNSFKLFDKYGVQDCKIFLVEYYPCNSKEELHTKESEYIKNNNCINKYIPLRTKKEYYEDNIEKIKQQDKEKYKRNRQYYLDKSKDRGYDKDYQDNYRQDNKDKIKEYHKIYYQKHREKLKEKQKQYRDTINGMGTTYRFSTG